MKALVLAGMIVLGLLWLGLHQLTATASGAAASSVGAPPAAVQAAVVSREAAGAGSDRVVPVPAAVDLAPGETVRVLTLDAWHAVAAFTAEEQVRAAATFYCESAWDKTVVGALGEVGIQQIHPINAGLAARLGYSWNEVATEPEVAGIVARAVWDAQGWGAWSC